MNEDVRRQTISIQNQIMIYIFSNDQFKQSTANEVGADNYEVRHAHSLLRFLFLSTFPFDPSYHSLEFVNANSAALPLGKILFFQTSSPRLK
jgi:hypothetical protein